MKPIINPWIVYVAGRCDLIWILSVISFVFLSMTLAILCALRLLDDTRSAIPKWLKIAVLISGLLMMFVPDKTTVLTMATLNYVTTDNIEMVAGTAIDVVDYVTDRIEDILKEE